MATPDTTTEIPDMTTNNNNGTKLRHELKHRINLREDLVLSQRLRKLFERDSHCGTDGSYRVTSLYFDTPYDDALRDKLSGISRREKFRIRYYGDNPTFIKLEKKSKINGLSEKLSVVLRPDEAERILSGDISFMLDSGKHLLEELYSKMNGEGLAPKTVVSYRREAFVYAPGNVRITLDRDVRTSLGSTDFLNPDVFRMPVMDGITVLEVKYDRFLPEIAAMAVQVPGRRASACSKYALCRRFD